MPVSPTGGSSDLLSQYAAQNGITLGQTAGPTTVNPTDPTGMIWMGATKTHGPNNKFSSDFAPQGGPLVGPKVDKTLTYAQVMSNFDQLSHEEQRKMAAYLALAGYLTTGADNSFKDVAATAAYAPLGAVRDAYASLVKDTVVRQRSLSQRVSPIQMLKQNIAYRLNGDGIKWNGDFGTLDKLTGVTGNAKGLNSMLPQDGDTKSFTQTSKARDIMDPEDAKGLTRAMLQQELGRDPTQAEYEDFIAMLQHAQAANPATQTTTTNMVYDSSLNGGDWRTVNESSVKHDGINVDGLNQLAYEKAQQNPGYAEWQAMGTYAPALFSALGATVPGVGSGG